MTDRPDPLQLPETGDDAPKRPAFAHLDGAGRPKVRYPTRKLARRWISRLLSRTDRQLYEYRCPTCDGWHLTHLKPTYRP